MTHQIRILLLPVLTVLLLTLVGCSTVPTDQTEATAIVVTEEKITEEDAAGAEPVELAHDFSLPTLEGPILTLSEQHGEYVLVNFWATWCVWCVEEMPYLQEVADRGEIQVWGINMRETVDEMNTFVAEHNITFPILLSPGNDTILAYPGGMPRTFIIGPDGDIVHTIFGPIDPTEFNAWLEANVS